MKTIVGICSGGGHLTELTLALKFPSVKLHKTYILTEEKSCAFINEKSLKFFSIIDPHVSVFLYLANTIQAIKYALKLRPDIVVTTGAGIAIPFFIICKALGAKTIYIESGARIITASKTSRVLYRFSDLFIVQSEHLLSVFPKATVGSII